MSYIPSTATWSVGPDGRKVLTIEVKLADLEAFNRREAEFAASMKRKPRGKR
jgi:hypothetical protein